MSNHSKSKCTSLSHRTLIANTRNRLNDLQERLGYIQDARKEGRISDLAILEEQVYQSLREWQAELSEPSPASLFQGGSIESFSDEIARLLQLCDEEDDATSALKEPAALKPQACTQNLCSTETVDLKPEHCGQSLCHISFPTGQEDCTVNIEPHEFQGFHQCNNTSSALHDSVVGDLNITSQLDYHLLSTHQEFDHRLLVKSDGIDKYVKDANLNIQPNICLPPSAFLGPKCALWDCTRPAQGSEWYQDYCSNYHANLALNEDSPGSRPIMRPGGICLKDNLLLDALNAKTQGKNVGIPECEGAASTKCPWNSSELFNLFLVEGETIREWLFFDKPRRAFESGNRKQRSLPDYNGRGWHESRKQTMKECGGQKRSYYMDPQPPGLFEWHLFEYQINECDSCALYRLELKLTTGKKSPKGKVTKDPLADLQKKMGRLTAEVASNIQPSPPVKGRTKATKGAADTVNDGRLDRDVMTTNETPNYGSGGSSNSGVDHSIGQPSQHQ